MNKTIIILISMFALVGCCTPQIKYVTRIETKTVYKPVFTPPSNLQQLPKIDRPDLVTNHFVEADKGNPGNVAKIVIEAAAQSRTYSEQLEDRIDLYENALKKPPVELPESTSIFETHESDKPFQ